ncbi:MAG: hypothetical protein ACK559_20500 [bacterium]
MSKNPYDIKMSDLTEDEIAGGESEAEASKVLKETEPKAAAPKPKAPPPKKVPPKKMAKGGKVRGDGCCTKGHTKGRMI